MITKKDLAIIDTIEINIQKEKATFSVPRGNREVTAIKTSEVAAIKTNGGWLIDATTFLPPGAEPKAFGDLMLRIGNVIRKYMKAMGHNDVTPEDIDAELGRAWMKEMVGMTFPTKQRFNIDELWTDILQPLPRPMEKEVDMIDRVVTTIIILFFLTSCGGNGGGNGDGNGDGDGKEPQITFTRDAANPVYTPSGSAWNFAGIGDPSVLYDSTAGLYKMWCSGGGIVAPDPDVLVRTQYLTSPDGTTWDEYGTNPIFTVGLGVTDWDRGGVETVHVLKDGDTYVMWYGGYEVREEPPVTMKIGLAISTDGIAWDKEATNPVVDKGAPGEWDDSWIESPSVVKVGGTYYMLYSGIGDPYRFAIGLATSADGIAWTKYAGNPVFEPEPANDWENAIVYAPSLYHDGSQFVMFYVGINATTFLDAARIGMATSSDCVTWTRSADNPLLDLPLAGSWDEHGPFAPSVIFKDGTWMMYYLSGSNPGERIGLATWTP